MIMRIYVLLLICQSAMYSFSQNCGIDLSIKNNYLNDAKILALRDIYSDTSSAYFDSVEISDGQINKYLDALSVVYLLNNQFTDTIFSIYGIHTILNVPCNEIAMKGDTSYTWIQNYLKDSVTSGKPQFDNLVSRYDFRLKSYIKLSDGVSIRIQSSRYLNVYPLIDSLEKIEGLSIIEAMSSSVGDGNNIEFSIINDTSYINFSKGWSDCQSGCLNRRYWKFSVYECNATFLGTSGDITSINNLYQTFYKIYPNPVNDIITIESWPFIERIDIYDIHGKNILCFNKISNHLNLSALKPGLYILKILSGKDVSNQKIIKR